ncbi:MAG: alanine--tRNA ligase [Chitinispirillia bacterium]
MNKSANQIREEFINFFKSKEHTFVKSSPVIPQDDPTLLFTNAGMNQFKSIFLGEPRKDLTRVVNSQKCMRVSGKHNDLEEVGIDHHHHTFFEMLGNWSFGDYYKREAIMWAWELLTEVWRLPKEKLYATVYRDDDESKELWKNVTDIDHNHISKHGEKDNFWEMGDTGPCGPSSEIHVDLGKGRCQLEKKTDHECNVNSEGCGRFLEIWNLVFIQFNRGKDGFLSELPNKHVDTGMGFERIVRILQNVQSNYESDVFIPVIGEIEKISGKKYSSDDSGIPFRVISDHIRSLVFSITDGAFPSNDGRGYVLRRLLRRAYRFGRKLDFKGPFLFKLVHVVVNCMGKAFPEITQRQEYVEKIIRSEEERFDQTLGQGIEKINLIIEKRLKSKQKQISGKDVFSLYDTYGFPMDLTRLIAAEHGIVIDEQKFNELMASQRSRARNAAKSGSYDGLSADGWTELKQTEGTEFVGFDSSETEVFVTKYKVLESNDKNRNLIKGLLILEKTPFYAEMGGQVGDKGVIIGPDQTELTVADTIKWNDLTVHRVKAEGQFPVEFLENRLYARINDKERSQTRKNHSATHLLQAALVKILGDHISQSGSRVGPDSLRFDFTHFKALSHEEIENVENLVNQWIWDNIPVTTEVKGTEEAKKEGATALFGEKYGETVRVVSMGSISKELCGGTHVSHTGSIGMFHIISESSIASGIRRIEAVTGFQGLNYFKGKENIINQLIDILKIKDDYIIQRIEEILKHAKSLEHELSSMTQADITGQVNKIFEEAKKQDCGLFPWTVQNLGSIDKKRFVNIIDNISDSIRNRNLDTTVIFIGAEVQKKALFAACAGKKAVKKYDIHCGNLVKASAEKAGGSGGGSPIRAQAGGRDYTKISSALQLAKSIICDKAGVS